MKFAVQYEFLKHAYNINRIMHMFFFEVLPFTDDAIVVNGKTSKKSMQKRCSGFWCV